MRSSREIKQLIGAAILVLVVFFLASYNLEYFPSIGFDEGIHLLVAKSLAVNGEYRFGPAVGPTLFFPIAAVFRLAEPQLLSARIVMVGYLLLCVAVFYTLARFLGGLRVATVGTLLFVSSPGVNLVRWGRQALGEVPATFFCLTGILIWLKAIEEERTGRRIALLLSTAALMGLAIVTKNQFLLLLPAWLLLWIADRLYYRQARHAHFSLPLLGAAICVAAWYSGQRLFFQAGERLAAQNVQEWTSALSRGLLTLSPRRMTDAVRLLTSQDAFYAWVLPGCAYAAVMSLRRSRQGLRWALLVLVAIVWFSWFILLSAGWPRYAFLPLAIAAILVAQTFYDLSGGYVVPVRQFVANIRSGRWDGILVGQMAIVALLLVVILRPLQGRFAEVLTGWDDSPQRMAAYIVENLPPGAEIETYDPEICFLSGYDCHLPPSIIMDASIEYAWYGAPPPSEYYDFQEHGAPYLLVGDFGRWVHLYDPVAVERDFELCVVIGEYELYESRVDRRQ